MADDGWTANEWLVLSAAGGLVSGYWQVAAVCGFVLLIRVSASAVSHAVVFAAKGIRAGMKNAGEGAAYLFTRPEPEEPEIQPPTRSEHAQKVSEKYEETCTLIDSLPLDDHEKEAMTIHAKKQLIQQMWGLLK